MGGSSRASSASGPSCCTRLRGPGRAAPGADPAPATRRRAARDQHHRLQQRVEAAIGDQHRRDRIAEAERARAPRLRRQPRRGVGQRQHGQGQRQADRAGQQPGGDHLGAGGRRGSGRFLPTAQPHHRQHWEAGAAETPIRVEAECSEANQLSYPRWERVHWKIPARGSLPPVTFTWHHGYKPDYAPGTRNMLGELLLRSRRNAERSWKSCFPTPAA